MHSSRKGVEFHYGLGLYADDAAAGVSARTQLQETLVVLDKTFTAFGLKMHTATSASNKSKTEFMYFPGRDTEERPDLSPIYLEEGQRWITATSSFRYLGATLGPRLTDGTEVHARIQAASKVFAALKDNIFATRDVRLQVKAKVYKALVLPVLLYCAETWAITAKMRRMLNSWHHKNARIMCSDNVASQTASHHNGIL